MMIDINLTNEELANLENGGFITVMVDGLRITVVKDVPKFLRNKFDIEGEKE